MTRIGISGEFLQKVQLSFSLHPILGKKSLVGMCLCNSLNMTCGLVRASYSLPEWQAVKLTFFAPCCLHLGAGVT